MANTVGAQDASSIWLQLPVVPKVRPSHQHLFPNQKPKKAFQIRKIGLPFARKIHQDLQGRGI